MLEIRLTGATAMSLKPVPNITPALTLKPLSPILQRLVSYAHKEIDEALLRGPVRSTQAVAATEAAPQQPALAAADARGLDTRV
jgi:hypothetical protein